MIVVVADTSPVHYLILIEAICILPRLLVTILVLYADPLVTNTDGDCWTPENQKQQGYQMTKHERCR
jgi:hypothetical protein